MESTAPHIVEGVVEVTGHLLGRSLIDFLRKNFITSGQVEQGDDFMDKSTVLLEQHLHLIQLEAQTRIRVSFILSVCSVCVRQWYSCSETRDLTGRENSKKSSTNRMASRSRSSFRP
jgi:hypothetical protein